MARSGAQSSGWLQGWRTVFDSHINMEVSACAPRSQLRICAQRAAEHSKSVEAGTQGRGHGWMGPDVGTSATCGSAPWPGEGACARKRSFPAGEAPADMLNDALSFAEPRSWETCAVFPLLRLSCWAVEPLSVDSLDLKSQ